MKKLFWLLLWFFFFGSVFSQSSVDPMNLPSLTQYVSDFSNVLDQSTVQELSTLWGTYNASTTNQLVAVLIPNRNGYELFDIGMNIFQKNQIGQAWKNNGLLLVISTEEKKIRIVVWYWLEWSLPDALASRIIEEDVRPLVNSGDFAGAIRKFYERSIQAIDTGEWTQYAASSSNIEDQKSKVSWGLWAFLWYILYLLLKVKFRHKKNRKKVLIGFSVFIVGLFVWLTFSFLFGLVCWLIFWVFWFMPGRGWFGFGWGFGGWGWFSGWGGSSGGWGAGD